MVQIPLRRAHRLRAIILASPTKKLRPQSTERVPTAWHTNDEYMNAEAPEEASTSSAVANVIEKRRGKPAIRHQRAYWLCHHRAGRRGSPRKTLKGAQECRQF